MSTQQASCVLPFDHTSMAHSNDLHKPLALSSTLVLRVEEQHKLA